MAAMARSTCSTVDHRPRVSRTADSARSLSRPIADRTGDADVEGVGQPVLGVAVEGDPVQQRLDEAAVEAVAQPSQSLPRAIRELVVRDGGRGAESDGEGDVLGPRAQPALLAAAVRDRLQLDAVADVERR